MRRPLPILIGLWCAAVGGGCSFLLDLEPNCDQVSDCTPYICNDENTACLADCRTDLDCAEGFVCDRQGDTCISQGCEAVGPPRTVFALSGSDFDYDVSRVDDNLWLLEVSSDGVSLVELTADGTVEGGSEGIIDLDDSEGALDPVTVATPSGVTAFWQGPPPADGFDFRVFRMDLVEGSRGPGVVYQREANGTASSLSAARLEDRLLLAWSIAPRDGRPQSQVLELNLDGTWSDDDLETAPEDAAVTVTEDATGSTLSVIGATATRAALARRETQSGVNDVVVSFLDSRLQRLNDHGLSGSGGVRIASVDAAGMSNALAVAWLEEIDGADAILRAVDGEGGTILGGTVSQDFTRDPVELDLAAGSAEFALAWVGTGEGRTDVFMRRFDEVGQPLFVAFSATSHGSSEPSRPRAVRTEDGYAVFWVEQATEPDELVFRRFVCAR